MTVSARGAGSALGSDSTGVDASCDAVSSFTSDGWTIGSGSANANQNANTYVAWSWDAGANSDKTYIVKVVSDSGNKYRFDDFGTSAVTLDLEEGSTYVFDASDSSVDSHPFVIGTSANSNEYSTGVTYTLDGADVTYSAYTSGFAAATTRKLTITVPASAPTLYYWCSVHSGMGGQINTNTTAGSSNFKGTTQSVVKANQTSGFSIVKWVGNASNATIGHGLSGEPSLIIVKNRDNSAEDWRVYHNGGDFTTTSGGAYSPFYHWRLNSTATRNGSAASAFTNTRANANNFTFAAAANANNLVAYCFQEIEGYSRFATYVGNGNADGPMIYTGFKPKWILLRRADGGGTGYDWHMFDAERDPINQMSRFLGANTNQQEFVRSDTANYTNMYIDFLSNGFKWRNSYSSPNHNTGTFIYAAFAENPFRNARAR